MMAWRVPNLEQARYSARAGVPQARGFLWVPSTLNMVAPARDKGTAPSVHAAFRQGMAICWRFNKGFPMIKILVAAALVVGLAGYALAQETVPGAPAGTAPMTPAPGLTPQSQG